MVIRTTVSEADYGSDVDKQLREYRRKANIPGFRPGMVPMGIINKMYRKGAIAETAYRKASEGTFNHLEENKIDFMGDMLPGDEQGDMDFDAATEHEFVFEIGVAPKVDLALDGDKVAYYKIKVAKDMREGYRSNFMRRFGRLEDVEKVTVDEALEVTLDNGEIKAEDAYIGLVSLSDDERKQFKGKKAGDSMIVNVKEIYKNPSQLASTLGVKAEELDSINPEFTATINRIRKFVEPALDEEFFKMAFPDGKITDEAGFDKFIDEQISADLGRESDYLFSIQLKNYLLGKASLQLPEEFLKKWLYAVNEGKFSMEEIEKDFPAFLRMMAWSLIQKHFTDTLNLNITQEDMVAEAKSVAQMQFAQYGMSQVPDETLTGYAKSILSNKEEAQKIFESIREKKVIEAVKPMVKVTEKSVSVEEFRKIAEEA